MQLPCEGNDGEGNYISVKNFRFIYSLSIYPRTIVQWNSLPRPCDYSFS